MVASDIPDKLKGQMNQPTVALVAWASSSDQQTPYQTWNNPLGRKIFAPSLGTYSDGMHILGKPQSSQLCGLFSALAYGSWDLVSPCCRICFRQVGRNQVPLTSVRERCRWFWSTQILHTRMLTTLGLCVERERDSSSSVRDASSVVTRLETGLCKLLEFFIDKFSTVASYYLPKSSILK